MSKTARFFAGLRVADEDPADAFLRVTSYRGAEVIEAPEGTVEVPANHVRFSVWVGDRAHCVVSIPESEARELAAFLTAETHRVETV
ncbi:MAG TPA: hypothetical protein VEV43_01985 [Actinomycetota bacterium]|nr:hypothetical protein [Actinomycetota bacterium]